MSHLYFAFTLNKQKLNFFFFFKYLTGSGYNNQTSKQLTYTTITLLVSNYHINIQHSNPVPVFGTEEALVEPILLARDTIVPFLIASEI